MKIGAVFPTCEIGNDPGAIRDFAQTAEELGYAHVVTYDHVLGAEHANREPALTGPYVETDAFHEPFVLFGYLAALTRKIELATGVIILPQRQAALVAKQAAELQVLSEGRLRLGVGTGWNWVEYDALGVPFARRGARMEEQIEVMRALWKGGTPSFDGEFHKFERAGILPVPDKTVPVWFGGFSPPAIRRAARIGDGFLFGAFGAPMQKLCEMLWAEVEAAGRKRSEVGVEAIIHYSEGPDQWRAAAEAWKALGATHFSMRAMDTGVKLTGEEPAGFTTPQQHIDALREFIAVVGDV